MIAAAIVLKVVENSKIFTFAFIINLKKMPVSTLAIGEENWLRRSYMSKNLSFHPAFQQNLTSIEVANNEDRTEIHSYSILI